MTAPGRRPNDGRTIVAVILAASVGLSAVILTAAAGWAIVDRQLEVPTAVVSLLSTGFGALIGAVATYLGFRAPADTTTPPPADETPPAPGP